MKSDQTNLKLSNGILQGNLDGFEVQLAYDRTKNETTIQATQNGQKYQVKIQETVHRGHYEAGCSLTPEEFFGVIKNESFDECKVFIETKEQQVIFHLFIWLMPTGSNGYAEWDFDIPMNRL